MRNIRLLLVILIFVFHTGQSNSTFSILNPSLPSDNPDKIEILVFFSYVCGHCAHMESLLEKWSESLPNDVEIKKIPVAFNSSMKPLQQLYFTFLSLNRLDLHSKVLKAIFVENQYLFNKKSINKWIKQCNEIDFDKFEATFNSFGVQSQIKRANHLTKFAKYMQYLCF
ncbi:MAG: thiol:disulfide interchange protein DsbA/DsbL [Bordetella sp.]|nr:MAG: thiol:disulfide interchange protein DsbA/DsbL [Bordetella sp.]